MRIPAIALSLLLSVFAAPAQEAEVRGNQRDVLGAADRLQVLGFGNSQLALETDDEGDEVAQQTNRTAATLWR